MEEWVAKEKRIKKPWCIYWFVSPGGVARIERDSGDIVWIKYSEDSSSIPWEKRYIRRFNTIFEAILKMGKHRDSPDSLFFITKRIARYFPSAAEEIWRAYEKYAKTAK